MIRVGIIGVGGISGAHIPTYQEHPETQIVALCDIIPERARGEGRVDINISTGGGTAVQAKAYTDYRELLADPEVDAVDLCLPTYLHAEVAVAALQAGKHVLSEKPMALTVADCDRMIAAAEASGCVLMVAHVIRFWPEYLQLKEYVDQGTYGAVQMAQFSRMSSMPLWTTDNWMSDPARCGGALLDLHIHDADFIAYLFGLPQAVTAQGVETVHGINQVIAQYHYADAKIVLGEGGWYEVPGFPFRATFRVSFEHAVIEMDGARGPLTVYPADGEPFTPELPTVNPYAEEIKHFLACIENGTKPTIVSPQDARDSIRLIEAEAAAVRTGTRVEL